jgi:carbamoyltransferase
MITLGVNESHGASACLFRDGHILAAAMEERFSRLKNDETYPKKSIEYCCKAAGIDPMEIDAVAMASYNLNPLYSIYKRNSGFSIDDWIKEQDEYWRPILFDGAQPSYKDIFAYRHDPEAFPYYYDFKDFQSESDWQNPAKFLELRKETLCCHLGISKSHIHVIPHYLAHSYYGMYASQMERCATLVFHAESGGDGKTASVMRFYPDTGLSSMVLTDQCFLGRIYKFMTLVMGMIPASHEYKIMGLAPYAHESYIKRSLKVLDGLVRVKGMDFEKSKRLTDSYHYFVEKFKGHRFDGVAGALQHFTESLLTTWVTNAVEATGISQIAFSGGVSMNVKANKAIADLPCVSNVFIPPSGGDESLCIGAVYKLLEDKWKSGLLPLEEIKPLDHAYLGPSFNNGDIAAAINSKDIAEKYAIKEKVSATDIAQALANGKVIARLAGPMEFGARALGNRSIMADPRNAYVVKKVNEQIKSRDFWMPFCPSILEERANDYLINPKDLRAPFMTIAFDTYPTIREKLIAALHPADFTARPHLVSQKTNPEYYNIIKAFEKITGVSAILNTSLNRHGFPIDCTPEDGLETFENSALDGIVLENTLVMRGEKGAT